MWGSVQRILRGWWSQKRLLIAAVAALFTAAAIVVPLTVVSSGSRAKVSVSNQSKRLGPGAGAGASTGVLPGSSTTSSTSEPSPVSSVVGSSPTGRSSGTASHQTAVGSPAAPGGIVPTSANPWHLDVIPQNAKAPDAVSCTGSGDCMAVGNSVLTTINGGASWQSATMPPIASSDYLFAVSCITASICWADTPSGHMFHTADGGATWSEQTLAAVKGLDGISCRAGGYCVALGSGGTTSGADGQEIFYTSDAGDHWTTVDLGTAPILRSVSCATTTTCWAVGGSHVSVTHDGGQTWSQQSSFPNLGPYSFMVDISCSDTTHCVAVGVRQEPNFPFAAIVFYTSDAGTTWTQASAPSSVDQLNGVSCFSINSCVAVGIYSTSAPGSQSTAGVVATGDGGRTWTTQYTQVSRSLQDISCLGSGQCWAVGSEPVSGTPTYFPAYIISNS
jgi:hypothetical protein